MTIITKPNNRRLPYDSHRLLAFVQSATRDYPHLDVDGYFEEVESLIVSRDEYPAEQISNTLIMSALDRVGIEDVDQHPDWTYVARYVLMRTLYKQAAKNRVYDAADKY